MVENDLWVRVEELKIALPPSVKLVAVKGTWTLNTLMTRKQPEARNTVEGLSK